ncbi:hypothetical protein [Phosphitispora sp. TUW77]|uniref:hypothetical protein n=1 Tax=Phosphitispora sp. TUW77 TaxID=3152361 RepID=UPI003AB79C7A
MNLLIELNNLLDGLSIPVETGVFSGNAPEEYVVITPLVDTYELYADNRPEYETQEARLSLFTKGSYTQIKRQIEASLISLEIIVTDRRYIGHENDIGYHHYAIDVAKEYGLED